MHNQDPFIQYANHPLLDIELQFLNTKANSHLLSSLLSFLKNSATLQQFNYNLFQAIQLLSTLDTFKSCDVEIQPGKHTNDVLVKFLMKDYRFYSLSTGFTADKQGERVYVEGCLRNLRRRCDSTKFKLEYSHTVDSYNYELDHHDRLFIPGKLAALYSLSKTTEEIDTNVLQHKYGGTFNLQTSDQRHSFYLSRYVRTNSIAVEYASRALLNELPVNLIYQLGHWYKHSTTDNPSAPTTGYIFSLNNELATGNSVYHKADISYSHYFSLFTDVVLQNSFKLGMFLPWSFTKTFFNDRYRYRFVKGFRQIEEREQPAKLPAGASPETSIYGDDLGRMSSLSLESKLHFYNTPFLSKIGLTPFLYANLIVPEVLRHKYSEYKDHARGSVGLGLGLQFGPARVELAYTSQVFKKSGDIGAEFQMVFAD